MPRRSRKPQLALPEVEPRACCRDTACASAALVLAADVATLERGRPEASRGVRLPPPASRSSTCLREAASASSSAATFSASAGTCSAAASSFASRASSSADITMPPPTPALPLPPPAPLTPFATSAGRGRDLAAYLAAFAPPALLLAIARTRSVSPARRAAASASSRSRAAAAAARRRSRKSASGAPCVLRAAWPRAMRCTK
mmetsp:Transcript_6267/g.19307  ORF Transcript_6267/g.19307 Transcript_6267/m.19307 type:complete len:202 (-) Transcript_6267:672-1277(-)